MAKTRSQTGNITIKKEEEDCKTNLVLNGVSNTTKITKIKPSKSNNRRLPRQPVKVEEDTDTKSLLQSTSKSSKLSKRRLVSQEQINQLIDAIVNDNMSVRKAASTLKICLATAHCYYNQYKYDPDKKIPLPRNQSLYAKTYSTQEQIENLIRYIVDDKMSISKASAIADMNYESGRHYYNKYLKDPAHNIPISRLCQNYTQDQNNELIRYIFNDKMSISAASRKANIRRSTASNHYQIYLKQHNIEIPVLTSKNRYTQEQVNKFIKSIVDDKMTIKAATRKANMSSRTGQRYYHRYLKDNNLDQPTRQYAQDKINKLLGYIIGDKMSISAASKKADMDFKTGRKYYRQYLKDHNLPLPVSKRIPQGQIDRLIGYIVDDRMSISAASKKVNINHGTGAKYYRQYLQDKKRDAPTRRPRVVPASRNG